MSGFLQTAWRLARHEVTVIAATASAAAINLAEILYGTTANSVPFGVTGFLLASGIFVNSVLKHTRKKIPPSPRL
jgi:rhamnose utilization protein RhaD (predicted bifunctional aldolase and dehydrogenase)